MMTATETQKALNTAKAQTVRFGGWTKASRDMKDAAISHAVLVHFMAVIDTVSPAEMKAAHQALKAAAGK